MNWDFFFFTLNAKNEKDFYALRRLESLIILC